MYNTPSPKYFLAGQGYLLAGLKGGVAYRDDFCIKPEEWTCDTACVKFLGFVFDKNSCRPDPSMFEIIKASNLSVEGTKEFRATTPFTFKKASTLCLDKPLSACSRQKKKISQLWCAGHLLRCLIERPWSSNNASLIPWLRKAIAHRLYVLTCAEKKYC
ncbi:hypothetical protein TTRE_0000382001 [Trichuris trichiura]|uniref:Uncharacterized protein n=1 Tax=Trichuris trichiura TaxID=36087 RepID=A0A077Z4X0_TRITR|nr:hypothetical protein TTRE_0000382001 [Trichuris trichiura]